MALHERTEPSAGIRPRLTAPSRRPLLTSAASQVIDALYAEGLDHRAWARAVADLLSGAMPSCAGVFIDVAGRGSLVATSGAGAGHERLVLHGRIGPQRGATLALAFEVAPALAASERALLSRMELHFDNAVRHRFCEAAPRLLVVSDESVAPDHDLWLALTRGAASLVSCRGARQPTYAVRQSPGPSDHRRLTSAQHAVLELAARGLLGKHIAYELGRSPASISLDLANAAAKIGVRSTFEVVQIAARLVGGAPAVPVLARLTATEREIVAFVQSGLSNAEIGKIRHRSVRTIANQVASALRKTEATSRRALGAAASRM